jgi:hypothetical protein
LNQVGAATLPSFLPVTCGAYTVQSTKFVAFPDFLQAEVTGGRVTVQTTAQVIAR